MIKVVSPGFYTTIQDFGRFGFQDFGVPFSGVMDRQSYQLANALIGNRLDVAALEITMTGPELLFKCDTKICITGAEMHATLNGNPIKNNKRVEVSNGGVLKFGKLSEGFRCYLGVQGGFQTEKIMDSRSMYANITQQIVIKKGQELAINQSNNMFSEHHAGLKVNMDYLKTHELFVFKGPEFNQLSDANKDVLLKQSFTISKDNNRMAYQLVETLENDLKPILTSLVLPGTVQLTPSGKLIVLMRDCQTTGGYPRVLQLHESAINVLSQKYSGQKITFKLF